MGPRRRAGRAGSRPNGQKHCQTGLSRPLHAPGAAQCDQRALAARHRRLNGPAIRVCEELFSAARSEIKNLEYFYFHNCPYEGLWKDNRRRRTDQMATWDVLRKYPSDYKVIFVGDATMSPYEITYFRRLGGALERGAGRALAAALR